jgi:hypothetical protein
MSSATDLPSASDRPLTTTCEADPPYLHRLVSYMCYICVLRTFTPRNAACLATASPMPLVPPKMIATCAIACESATRTHTARRNILISTDVADGKYGTVGTCFTRAGCDVSARQRLVALVENKRSIRLTSCSERRLLCGHLLFAELLLAQQSVVVSWPPQYISDVPFNEINELH